jgi:hypothetical protein
MASDYFKQKERGAAGCFWKDIKAHRIGRRLRDMASKVGQMQGSARGHSMLKH